jgi:hypothetical protein
VVPRLVDLTRHTIIAHLAKKYRHRDPSFFISSLPFSTLRLRLARRRGSFILDNFPPEFFFPDAGKKGSFVAGKKREQTNRESEGPGTLQLTTIAD